MVKRRPTKPKDRYAALEDYRKIGELNKHRRRKTAAHEALNHHLELERLKGHVSSQRMATLNHTYARMAELKRMIQKVNPTYQS